MLPVILHSGMVHLDRRGLLRIAIGVVYRVDNIDGMFHGDKCC